MSDLWKLTLMRYRRESDWEQKQDKEIIIKAFSDMINSGTPPLLWKTYIDGIMMFPEMIDSLMEYMADNKLKGVTVRAYIRE